MVGGLSSQVENAAGINKIDCPPDSSVSATSVSSSERSAGIGNDAPKAPQVVEDFGVLEVASNGDLVVGEGFWTVFCKEVEDIFEAVQGHTVMHFDDGSSSSVSDVSPHTGYYNFLLRSTSIARHKKDVYPLPSQMLFLWQIFVDNVDPFIKILHVPSMTKIIQEIRSSYDSLSASLQALVLSISLAAIMSLEDAEASRAALHIAPTPHKVQANFHTEKGQLLAQYRLGTEQALVQADFLNNSDMILLQALAIYISVLQYTGETKTAWILAGILVRAAASMKLHLDGSKLANITQFDVQMRRRLWWHICLIDSRSESSQLSVFKLSQNMFETEKPTNIDDAALNANMSQPPVDSYGWTDTSTFLLRSEIWALSRQLQSIADTNQKLQILKKTDLTIKDTYLKHIDPNRPLQAFIETSVRLFLTKVNLMLPQKITNNNNNNRQLPHRTGAQALFTSCLAVIDYTYSLQNEPSWSGWRWQIQGRQLPWNALRTILGHLSTAAWQPLYDQALTSARRSLETLPEASRSDPRYHQLLMQLSIAENAARDVPQNFGGSIEVAAESMTPMDLHFSQPFSHSSINETSTGTPQESFLCISEFSGAEMDWHNWNEFAGDLEIWGMGGV
ncbi:hypothetical protein ACEPPN_012145 [Leptodophora sp. 'Broadleaf-Isolate-01']